MIELAIVAPKGAYMSSVGALVDWFDLLGDRQRRVLGDAERQLPEIRLHVLCANGEAPQWGPFISRTPAPFASHRERMDFVWLPGFMIGDEQDARKRLHASAPLCEWLQWQAGCGATIGASGASSLLLLHAGLWPLRQIPCAAAMTPLLQALFPRVGRDERQAIVQSGSVIISSGFGNDIELVARVMERIASPASSAWFRSVTGTERTSHHTLAEDPLVSAAQLQIERQFSRGLAMAQLAKDLAISQPTLIRRFRKALGLTPGEYLREQRMMAAQRLLLGTNRSVDAVARMVGYADTRNFREQFRSQTGMSAREFRRRAANPRPPSSSLEGT